MFLEWYRLLEQPFGVTPDPKFIYFSQTHREALASLAYGIETGCGFMALLAKPGMGKTTLLFRLMEHLENRARTVYLFQSQCNPVDLLRYILADLKVESSGTDLVELHEQLNEILLREAHVGRRVVVAIDEAQNFERPLLETIRLLSDFETPRRKLLQIILSGQPELAEKLARPDLAQLRQRVTSLCRLTPFSLQETAKYIDHRLQVAGYQGPHLFTQEAVNLIARESQGIPRVINTLCFNALSIGCALGRSRIDPEIIREALADLSVHSLLKEIKAAPAVTQLMPISPVPVEVESSTNEIEASRDTPLSEALAAARVVAAPMPTTPSPDRAAAPVAQEIEVRRDTAPVQMPASAPIPEPRNPSSGFSYQSAVMLEPATSFAHQVRKIKWLAGTGFLGALLLGLALQFDISETSAPSDGTRAAISEIAPAAKAQPSSSRHSHLSERSLARKQVPSGNKISQVARDTAKKDLGATVPVVHVVQPNETLGGISLQYLGRYDSEFLKEVQKLNSGLTDVDRILVRQKVLLPPQSVASAGKNSSEKNASESTDPSKERQ